MMYLKHPDQSIELLVGKHAGKKLQDIDDDYLMWMVENVSPSELADAALEELEFRRSH